MKFIIKKDKEEKEEVELYLEEEKEEGEDEINLKVRYIDEDGEEETDYLMTFRNGKFYREPTDMPEDMGIEFDKDNKIKEEKD